MSGSMGAPLAVQTGFALPGKFVVKCQSPAPARGVFARRSPSIPNPPSGTRTGARPVGGVVAKQVQPEKRDRINESVATARRVENTELKTPVSGVQLTCLGVITCIENLSDSLLNTRSVSPVRELGIRPPRCARW